MSKRFVVEKKESPHTVTMHGRNDSNEIIRDISVVWNVIDTQPPKEAKDNIFEVFDSEEEANEYADRLNNDLKYMK